MEEIKKKHRIKKDGRRSGEGNQDRNCNIAVLSLHPQG